MQTCIPNETKKKTAFEPNLIVFCILIRFFLKTSDAAEKWESFGAFEFIYIWFQLFYVK